MLVLLEQPFEMQKWVPLISGTNGYVVMGGVLSGLQAGRVYADHPEAPKSALIWARNEMFYLIGRSDNERFNRLAKQVLVQKLLPEALKAGEDMLNLEVYPETGFGWDSALSGMFEGRLREGVRVPFRFRRAGYERRLDHRLSHNKPKSLPPDYQLHAIDMAMLMVDRDDVIQKEILKFWHSVDDFIRHGCGTCIVYQGQIVGTCISVFVCDSHYETGIHVYDPLHRGKGLATAMADTYIQLCLEQGGIPHWTTEHFRMDSIAIASKLGFEQLPVYPVYYMPIHGLLNNE